ncbi:hypothetical protein BC833DRAFT_597894 [Globomyces pollinis-pini]|nr:hypothetical protein BC833DRAFT_597894 [Globomyces pollinis-pini]
MSLLTLDLPDKLQSVKPSPVTLFAILDHFAREEGIAYGILVGKQSATSVSISDSFPITFSENNIIDHELIETSLDLLRQIDSSLDIVGWYLVGDQLTQESVEIHESLDIESEYPVVCLVVDVNKLANATQFPVNAYISDVIGQSGTYFIEVPCITDCSDADVSGLELIDELSKLAVDEEPKPHPSDLQSLKLSLLKVQELIESISSYVDDVNDKKIEINEKIGRHLLDTVTLIPKLDPVVFENVYQSHAQDLMAIAYLATLTKSQLAIAERLQKLV